MTNVDDNDVIDARAVARKLGLSERTIGNLVRKGEIPSIKIGGSRRFSRKRIEGWLDEKNGGRHVQSGE